MLKLRQILRCLAKMLVVSGLLLFTGCSTPSRRAEGNQQAQQSPADVPSVPVPAVPEPSPQPKEYDIVVHSELSQPRNLTLDITSNLPMGSSLVIQVTREYYQRGKADAYVGMIFEKEIALDNGRIHVAIPVNDAEWFNNHQRLLKVAPDELGAVVRTSPNVEVGVWFGPSRQTQQVQRIVGAHGEFLRGKSLTRYGMLDVRKKVSVPFDKGVAENELRVSEQTFGKAWPFTVKEGVLRCNPEAGRDTVTLRVGGKTYAVNGTARASRKYLPVESIWAKDPDNSFTRKNISTVIERGLSLCR